MGSAGYIAPKHIKAIKDVSGRLIATLDPHDSMGILDSYFPGCKHFTEFEIFDRFCSRQDVDYVSICSPNYLHDAHCRFGLRLGANVICEKPLVLNERNLDGLLDMQDRYQKKINCILQLRLNEDLIQLRKKMQESPPVGHSSLIYFTPRGEWYRHSWKGDIAKSGGIIFNIGVHLFDLICWLFGPHVGFKVNTTDDTVTGTVYFVDAVVDFELSINRYNLPTRALNIDGNEYQFSNGFTDLHTKSYQEILAGNGFGVEDVRQSIRLCGRLRDG